MVGGLVYRVLVGLPQPANFQKKPTCVFGCLDFIGFELVGELEQLVNVLGVPEDGGH